MKMLSCIVGTLVALFVTEASAQRVKAQTGVGNNLVCEVGERLLQVL
jgi:hypothetical protein